MKFDAKIFLRKNASLILSVVSIAGFIGTVATAVKATPKAMDILKERQEEKEEPLTTLEKVKYAAPVYIPTVLTGLATAACIVGAGVLNERQVVAVSAGYSVLADQYNRYKNKVREIYGEEAHRDIMRQIDLVPCEPKTLYACSGFGDNMFEFPEENEQVLFYDAISESYFISTYYDVLNAIYHLNRNFTGRGYSPVDEYYGFLGLKTTIPKLGWRSEPGFWWVDFSIYRAVTDDGLEIYIIEPMFWPMDGYDDEYR